MMTPKENFLELLKPNGQPDRQLCQYEALHMCLNDPINTYLRGNRKRGTVSKDRWGTTISFPTDAPGPMPVTADGLAVCPDVTHWRDTVHAPDIDSCTEGWEACRTAARAACGQEKLLAGFMGTGIFEQCHFLMGFEDTLTNLYEHPDEMRQLIEYITEYRLRYVQLLIDRLQPDVIFSHDDWGTKDALFMHPDMWREFFKEPYRRFYGYIRSRGVIAIHHADSYLVPIVEDMAEIGIQVWQGVLPENDIPALQRQLNGRLVLMGGMGAAIDRADAAPEEIYGYAMDRTYYNRFYRGPLPVSELMDHLGKPAPARYGILLAHHPAYRSSYASYGADLTLSGHYHGGVVGLGAHRGLVTPDFRLFSKNCRGLFLTGGTCQIISAGTGEHTIPVRIWNRRELIITDIGKT